MAYLLDTHVVLWTLDNNDLLSSKAESIISDLNSDCFVSVISFFEITIKKNIGKLELSKSIQEYMNEVQRIGIMLLPIKDEYLSNYTNIPLFENHRDPFDRLILATAFTDKLQILSADNKFQLYRDVVDVTW
jgi:PIN domain nuclease of toxin-antitoxin system